MIYTNLVCAVLLHHFVTDPTIINSGKDVGDLSFVRVILFSVLDVEREGV